MGFAQHTFTGRIFKSDFTGVRSLTTNCLSLHTLTTFLKNGCKGVSSSEQPSAVISHFLGVSLHTAHSTAQCSRMGAFGSLLRSSGPLLGGHNNHPRSVLTEKLHPSFGGPPLGACRHNSFDKHPVAALTLTAVWVTTHTKRTAAPGRAKLFS